LFAMPRLLSLVAGGAVGAGAVASMLEVAGAVGAVELASIPPEDGAAGAVPAAGGVLAGAFASGAVCATAAVPIRAAIMRRGAFMGNLLESAELGGCGTALPLNARESSAFRRKPAPGGVATNGCRAPRRSLPVHA
jgi:hypothetical protein